MEILFDLNETFVSDPAIETWWGKKPPELANMARQVFDIMRQCGSDVREALHDDAPTACVGRYPFAYVNAYTRHVNAGFFHGAFLPDPEHLLEGTGKRMRHIKLRPGQPLDETALRTMIEAAYKDLQARLHTMASGDQAG